MKKLLRVCLAAAGLLALFSALQLCSAAWGRPYQTGGKFKVLDHVVYYNAGNYYTVVDYFDTDAAAAAATQVVIRAKVDGKPVKRISLKSGYNGTKQNVTRFSIPSSVTYIGKYAFQGYAAVKQLTLPAELSTLGESACKGMTSLTELTLPKKIRTISAKTFDHCSSLKKVTCLGDVREVGANAFYQCKSLSSMRGYSKLTYIDDSAFAGTGFQKVKVYRNAIYGRAVFANCKKLTQVEFETASRPYDISVPYGMFSGCKKLKTLRFPSAVNDLTFDFHSFQNCTSLQTLTLPKTARRIYFSESSFLGCTALRQVENVTDIVTIGSSAFSGCSSLSTVTIPAGAQYVAAWAFYNCPSLQTLKILSTSTSLLQTRFVNYVPTNCRVYVKTRAMKQAIEDGGFLGKVIVNAKLT